MMLLSPLALSPAVAISGGQFVAQSPLHALLPEPAASLSNTYSVMPSALVSTHQCLATGAAFGVAQATSRAKPAREEVNAVFMGSPFLEKGGMQSACMDVNTLTPRFIPSPRKFIQPDREPHYPAMRQHALPTRILGYTKWDCPERTPCRTHSRPRRLPRWKTRTSVVP